MTLIIREAADADTPVLARLMTTVQPGQPWTPESLAHQHEFLRSHPLRLHLQTWLAERNGQPVGMAAALQFPGMYHPDRYHAELMVLPDFARRGIGTRLAQVLETHLRKRGAQEVQAGAEEDQPLGIRFLEQRGFTEAMRFWDNVLKLEHFHLDAWQEHEHLPDGVRIVSLAQLEQDIGQERARLAYYEALAEARLDVPRTGEATAYTREDHEVRYTHPAFYPAGILLAVTSDNEVVALSELWKGEGNIHRLDTGLTGTRRAWRRKGLALALKLAGIRVARAYGATEIWTNNSTQNAPMLAINDRLGYKPRPAHIEFKWGQL